MRTFTIFLVWQSDVNAARSILNEALDECAIGLSSEVLEVSVDQDTRGEAGAVTIDHVILDKIARADAVVCDLTVVGHPIGSAKDQSKGLPNPNVMFEAGYAFAALGAQRVVLVRRSTPTGDLPFDIRQRRRIEYQSKSTLLPSLRLAIEAIISIGPSLPGLVEQRATVIRMLPQAQATARIDLSVELALLAERSDDTWSRLSAHFAEDPPVGWKPDWPYGEKPERSVKTDIRTALLASHSVDDRDAAIARIESFLVAVEDRKSINRLIGEVGDWAPSPNYSSGGSHHTSASLSAGQAWLDAVEARGFDMSAAQVAWTAVRDLKGSRDTSAVKAYGKEIHAVKNALALAVPGTLRTARTTDG